MWNSFGSEVMNSSSKIIWFIAGMFYMIVSVINLELYENIYFSIWSYFTFAVGYGIVGWLLLTTIPSYIKTILHNYILEIILESEDRVERCPVCGKNLVFDKGLYECECGVTFTSG